MRKEQNESRYKIKQKQIAERLKGVKYNNRITYDAIDRIREKEHYIITKSKSY